MGHIAHIPDAIRIIEDRVIRAGLIWDESCLRETRMCVSWVSPNYWPQSIYGNVRFEYDWYRMSEGKRYYWVEAMSQYSPTAVRILVSANDHDRSPYLTRFDPSARDGPLWWNGDRWWRNGEFTMELMVDDDLRLRDSKEIAFESHHPHICSKGGCADSDVSSNRAAVRLVATLLGERLTQARNQLITRSADGQLRQTSAFDQGFGQLVFELEKSVTFTGHATEVDIVDAIVSAALVEYGRGEQHRAGRICSVLRTQAGLRASLLRLAEQFLGFPHRRE